MNAVLYFSILVGISQFTTSESNYRQTNHPESSADLFQRHNRIDAPSPDSQPLFSSLLSTAELILVNSSASLQSIRCTTKTSIAFVTKGSQLSLHKLHIDSSSIEPLFYNNLGDIRISELSLPSSSSPLVSSSSHSSFELQQSSFKDTLLTQNALLMSGSAGSEIIRDCLFENVTMLRNFKPALTDSCTVDGSLLKATESGIYGGIVNMPGAASFGMKNSTLLSNFRDGRRMKANSGDCDTSATGDLSDCGTSSRISRTEISCSFTDCTFEACFAKDENGGAIYFSESQDGDTPNILTVTLTVTRCSFDTCSISEGEDEEGGSGSAIYCKYSRAFYLSQSNFTECQTASGNPAAAVYAYEITDCRISSCIFYSCTTDSAVGGLSLEKLSTRPTVPILSDSSFYHCQADFYGGALGIFSDSSPAHTLSGCLFESCYAGQFGGAIFWQSPQPNSKVRTSIFAKNTVDRDGNGADVTFYICSIENPPVDLSTSYTIPDSEDTSSRVSVYEKEEDDPTSVNWLQSKPSAAVDVSDPLVDADERPRVYLSPLGVSDKDCGTQTRPCTTLTELMNSTHTTEKCKDTECLVLAESKKAYEKHSVPTELKYSFELIPTPSTINAKFPLSFSDSDTNTKALFTVSKQCTFTFSEFPVYKLSLLAGLHPSLFRVTGSLTFTHCTFTGPTEDTLLSGSVIEAPEGTLTLRGVSFENFELNNSALISASSTVTVEKYEKDGTPVENTFNDITRHGGNGTVFNIVLGASATLSDATFTDCDLYNEEGSLSGFGGAIYLNVTDMAATLTLSALTFHYVSAPAGGQYIHALLPSAPTGTGNTNQCSDKSTWTSFLPSVEEDPYYDDLYVFENGKEEYTTNRYPLKNFFELLSCKFVGTTYYDVSRTNSSNNGTYYYPLETLYTALSKDKPSYIFILYGDTTKPATISSGTAASKLEIGYACTIAGVGPTSKLHPVVPIHHTSPFTTDSAVTISAAVTFCRLYVQACTTSSSSLSLQKPLFTVATAGVLKMVSVIVDGQQSTFSQISAFSLTGKMTLLSSTIKSFAMTGKPLIELNSLTALQGSTGSTISTINRADSPVANAAAGSVLSLTLTGAQSFDLSGITFAACTSTGYGGAVSIVASGSAIVSIGTTLASSSESDSTEDGEESPLSFYSTNTASHGGAIFISITGIDVSLSLNQIMFPNTADQTTTSWSSSGGSCVFVKVDDTAWVTDPDLYQVWQSFGDLLPSGSEGADGTPDFQKSGYYVIEYPSEGSTASADMKDIPFSTLVVNKGLSECTTTKCATLGKVIGLKAYADQSSPVITFETEQTTVETEPLTISCRRYVTLRGTNKAFPMAPITQASGNKPPLFTIGSTTCTPTRDTSITVFIDELTLNIRLSSNPPTLTLSALLFSNVLFSVLNGATLLLHSVNLSSTPYTVESQTVYPILQNSAISAGETSNVTLISVTCEHIEQCDQSASTGGSVYKGTLKRGGSLTVDGCTFTSCCTYSGNGGAIWVQIDGGTVNFAQTKDVLFKDCHADKNESETYDPLRPIERVGGSGGALYITISAGTLNMGTTQQYTEGSTTTTPSLKIDSCYGDKEVGFGGAYFISHTGNSDITFGKHLFTPKMVKDVYGQDTDTVEEVSTQGTFVYFVSTVQGYITQSERFQDLLQNSEFDKDDKPYTARQFNKLDYFVAYDRNTNKTYQMYMIGSTEETVVEPFEGITTDAAFCGVVFPCYTLEGAVTYAGEFVNKPKKVRLRTSDPTYTLNKASQTLRNSITIEGEEPTVDTSEIDSSEEESKQEVQVDVSATEGAVLIIAAAVTFKDITFQLKPLNITLFQTLKTGALTLDGVSFTNEGSFTFSATLIDASLSTLTLTNWNPDFTEFSSPSQVPLISASQFVVDETVTSFAATSSGEEATLLSIVHPPPDETATSSEEIIRTDTVFTFADYEFTVTDVTALSVTLTGESATIQKCKFIQKYKKNAVPALIVDVNTGDAILEDVIFRYEYDGETNPAKANALELSVDDGTATLTRCNFYNLASSSALVSITVEAAPEKEGKLDITECQFLGCTAAGKSVLAIQVENAPTTIQDSTFTPLEYVEETESSQSDESSSQGEPDVPDNTGSAISATCANSKFTISDGCTFDYFKSAAVTVTLKDPKKPREGTESESEEMTYNLPLTFDGIMFTKCSGAISATFTGVTTPKTTTSLTLTGCTFADALEGSDAVSISISQMSEIAIKDNVFTNTREEETDEATGDVSYKYPKTGKAVTLKTDLSNSLSVTGNTFAFFTASSDASAVYVDKKSASYCEIETVAFEENTFTSGVSPDTDQAPTTYVTLKSLLSKSLVFLLNEFTAEINPMTPSQLSCGGGISVQFTPSTRNGFIRFNNNTFTGLVSYGKGGAISLSITKGADKDASNCLPSVSFTNITCTSCTTTAEDAFVGAALYLSGPADPSFTIGRVTLADSTFTDCYTAGKEQPETVYVGTDTLQQMLMRNNTFTNTRTRSSAAPDTPCCLPPASSYEESSSSTADDSASSQSQSMASESGSNTEASSSSEEGPSEEDEEGTRGYEYPLTCRAVTLHINTGELLSLKKNTFKYFTSTTSQFGSVYVAPLPSDSGTPSIAEVSFEQNTFVSGPFAFSLAYYVYISNIEGTIRFESNSFSTTVEEDSSAHCSGGVYILYSSTETETSITFIANTFTGFHSAVGTAGHAINLETESEDSSLPAEISITDSSFIDYYPINNDRTATVSIFDKSGSVKAFKLENNIFTNSGGEDTSTSSSSNEASSSTEGASICPFTAKALVYAVKRTETLTVTKNRFEYYTSSSIASSVAIRLLSDTDTANINDLVVAENTFITGIPDSLERMPCVCLICETHSAVVDGNTFTTSDTEEDADGCLYGAFKCKLESNSKNSTFTFTNNVFRGFISVGYQADDTSYSPASLDIINLRATLENITFTDCSAVFGGGMTLSSKDANVTLTDVRFSSCKAAEAGGSLYIQYRNTNLTFISTTKTQPTFFDSSTEEDGGAVYLISLDTSGYPPESTITFRGLSFDSCAAEGSGGAIYARGCLFQLNIRNTTFTNTQAWKAGALCLDLDNCILFLTGSTFTNCSAVRRGGAAYISNTQDMLDDSDSEDSESIQKRDVLGDIRLHTTSEPVRDAHVYISEVEVENCSVTGESSGGGMCIVLQNGSLNMSASSFTRCVSTFSGGGLYLLVEPGTNATLNTTTFTNCTAVENGGGALLGLANATLEIAGCTFQECAAENSGGGVYLGMTTGRLSLLPSLSRYRGSPVKNPVAFINCQAGAVATSNAHARMQTNAEAGCGGGLYIQVTADERPKTVTKAPRKEESVSSSTSVSSSVSAEPEPVESTEYNTDEMFFFFYDVQFSGSSALKGNALYLVANHEDIIGRDEWKDLIPADANSSDFVYSIVNVTVPVSDLSLIDNSSYIDTIPYPPQSKSSSKLGGGYVALIVIMVILFVGLIVLLVLCCIISSCPLYRWRKSQGTSEEEAEGIDAENPSESVASPPAEEEAPAIDHTETPRSERSTATPTPANTPTQETVSAPPEGEDTQPPQQTPVDTVALPPNPQEDAEPTVGTEGDGAEQQTTNGEDDIHPEAQPTDTQEHFEPPHEEEPHAEEMKEMPTEPPAAPEPPQKAQPPTPTPEADNESASQDDRFVKEEDNADSEPQDDAPDLPL